METKMRSLITLVAVVCTMLVVSCMGVSGTVESEKLEQCKQAFDKSAVTKEAAETAAKVIKNPPTYSTEVYSSKVQSKMTSRNFGVVIHISRKYAYLLSYLRNG